MRWFGESWGAPVCVPELRIPVPPGGLCVECGEKLRDDSQGLLVFHIEVEFSDVEHYTEGTVVEHPHHIDCFMERVASAPYRRSPT